MVTTMEDLHSDVLTCALRRLDGRSLAAASCATASLRTLTADPKTWRALCLAKWPSLALHPRLLPLLPPRRLFADAFPFPSPDAATFTAAELPGELISAIDIHYKGVPLLSCVVEMSTSSSWFLGSPFRIDAVERKNPTPACASSPEMVISPGELELSWVMVDPASGRAVNVSSRQAVAVDRHWYTGETLVRYAVVFGGCKFETVVACSEETGQVREVSLGVEDADGAAVRGEGSLRLVAAAMEGQRKGGEKEGEEVQRRYEEFVRRKRGREERKARREVLVDLCCSAVSTVAVLTFVAAVMLR